MTSDKAITYPFSSLPAPGKAVSIGTGLLWVRMPLPFALDHINLWLLSAHDGWVIIDCGLSNDITRKLWDQVIEDVFHGEKVRKIVGTHHHPDHVGNAGWLVDRFDAQFWMAQAEYFSAHALRDGTAGYAREQLATMFLRNGLSEDFVPRILAGRDHYRRSVPDFPQSFRRISEGDELNLGGHDWQAIIGYGHAPEHVALHSEALGVLISGDMLLPRISTNVSVPAAQPWANPLKLFLDSLEKYAKLPEDTLVLPSHGLPFRGARTRVAQLQHHHRLRLDELLQACLEPKSAADVLTTLFKRKLDDHQMLFAMGEAMAHLHYLHDLGELERLDDAKLVRYQRR